MTKQQTDVTMLLNTWGDGRDDALEEMPLVYQELRKLARSYLRAELMRRILVNHARKRQAEKRGGGRALIPFEDAKGVPAKAADVVALDDALKEFATIDPRSARIVELRQFGGLSIDEPARDARHLAGDGQARLDRGQRRGSGERP